MQGNWLGKPLSRLCERHNHPQLRRSAMQGRVVDARQLVWLVALSTLVSGRNLPLQVPFHQGALNAKLDSSPLRMLESEHGSRQMQDVSKYAGSIQELVTIASEATTGSHTLIYLDPSTRYEYGKDTKLVVINNSSLTLDCRGAIYVIPDCPGCGYLEVQQNASFVLANCNVIVNNLFAQFGTSTGSLPSAVAPAGVAPLSAKATLEMVDSSVLTGCNELQVIPLLRSVAQLEQSSPAQFGVFNDTYIEMISVRLPLDNDGRGLLMTRTYIYCVPDQPPPAPEMESATNLPAAGSNVGWKLPVLLAAGALLLVMACAFAIWWLIIKRRRAKHEGSRMFSLGVEYKTAELDSARGLTSSDLHRSTHELMSDSPCDDIANIQGQQAPPLLKQGCKGSAEVMLPILASSQDNPARALTERESVRPSAASSDPQHAPLSRGIADNAAALQALKEELGMDHLELQNVISRGAMGTFYTGSWRGIVVAAKVVIFDTRATEGESIKQAAAEAAVAYSLQHPNLVVTFSHELKQRRATEDQPFAWQLHLVQELCNGGTLAGLVSSQLLLDQHDEAMMGRVLPLLLDIASAMEHVHSKDIIHGNLHPFSILLHIEDEVDKSAGRGWKEVAWRVAQGLDSKRCRAKLTDFGLGMGLGRSDAHASAALQGMDMYCAPESLEKRQRLPASDVYSFGVIMWVLVYSCEPFSLHHSRCKRHPDFPSFPKSTPPMFAQLARQCMSQRPADRPSFHEIQGVLASVSKELASTRRPEPSMDRPSNRLFDAIPPYEPGRSRSADPLWRTRAHLRLSAPLPTLPKLSRVPEAPEAQQSHSRADQPSRTSNPSWRQAQPPIGQQLGQGGGDVSPAGVLITADRQAPPDRSAPPRAAMRQSRSPHRLAVNPSLPVVVEEIPGAESTDDSSLLKPGEPTTSALTDAGGDAQTPESVSSSYGTGCESPPKSSSS